MNLLTVPRSRYSLKVEGDAEELEDGFSSATRECISGTERGFRRQRQQFTAEHHPKPRYGRMMNARVFPLREAVLGDGCKLLKSTMANKADTPASLPE